MEFAMRINGTLKAVIWTVAIGGVFTGYALLTNEKITRLQEQGTKRQENLVKIEQQLDRIEQRQIELLQVVSRLEKNNR